MRNRLPHLDVGSARCFGSLTLFPVWVDAPSASGIGWSLNSVDVSEMPSGGQVDRLAVRNFSREPTMLIEGDLLRGGFQHRMAAASVLLPARMPAGRSLPVDVVCVEQGRWSGAETHRANDARASFVVRQSNRLHRDEENFDAAQHAVWQRIARFDAALQTSATNSLLDHLDASAEVPVRPMRGQQGVVVGIGGEIVGLELFGSIRALASRWAGLVRAATLDARLAPHVKTRAHLARDFVSAVGGMTLDPREPAGDARAYAGRSGGIRISAIGRESDRSPLHLTAFNDGHPLARAA